jgi:translation initiation factor IF-3
LLAKAPEALVIDEKGVNLGIIATADAIAQANARGLRVVVVRDSKPPVYKLEAPQHAETATKSSKGKDKSYDPDALHERIKEIRISDKITEHDLQVKISKTMQHLLSRHRVKVELKFKYRTEFDPVVAKALMENVVARLAEISTIETPMKSMDDRACFMMLKPLSTKQLIARGFLEDPSKVSEKDDEVDLEVAAAREKAASREERNRAAQLEKEELKQQGLLKKRFKSPVEQTKDEDDKDRLKGKPEKKREEPEDEEDEYGYDDEDEDIDFGPGRRR